MKDMQPSDIKLIVCETLTALGFDLREPQAIQADIIYLRKMRVGSEAISTRMKFVLAGTFLSTSLWLVWQGMLSVLKHGAP